MSVRPVTPLVWPHGLVIDADGIDRDFDDLACEDPEHRTRGLRESPSKFLTRRAASYPPPTRSASVSSPAGLPGVPSSSVGASGDFRGVPGWSPARQ